MKKVLWISRHTMTDQQLADLETIMGGPVRLVPWQTTVDDPKELLPELEACDAVAAVLPPLQLSQLLKLAGSRPLLRAVMDRVPTGRTVVTASGTEEPEYASVYLGWEQILKVEIVTRRLC